MTVQLNIERLVLEGILMSARERLALASALEHELALALEAGPPRWPTRGLSVRRVQGPAVPSSTSRDADGWAAAVAASVHGGLGRAVER